MAKEDDMPHLSSYSRNNPAFQGNEGGDNYVIEINPNSTANGNGSQQDRTRRKASFAAASTLSAHNIDYSVKIKQRFYKPVEEKQILHNVSAIFRQGMNAILGPSGCGKSSFLDLLAGRVDQTNVKGTLLIDGKPTPKNFKCMVGYVVQDDVVMGTLTVRENLAFSAALRLPKSVAASEKSARVDDVIKELGLNTCADTKVGNELIRGVSGGERKRCNIGMELIIRPSVLFLDEPTTGLDANTASTVLLFLKSLSDRGRTIIFSIHQPRYAIYRLFDSVLLLSAGHTIYHGPANQALDFFERQGYRCQEHNNPPDFFLDVINGDPSTLEAQGGKDNKLLDASQVSDIVKAKHKALVEGFKNSAWNNSLLEESEAIYSNYQELHRRREADVARVDYATSFLTQLAVLSKRTVKNIVRNPQIGVATFMSVIFFSLIASAIYYDITDNPVAAVNDRRGALFFLVLNQMFLNMSAVETLIGERKYFLHENITGFYRVSVYFFVKIVCDILPLRILPVLVQGAIVYPAIGFRSGPEDFFKFILTMSSVSLAATSLCFMLSAILKAFAVTQLLLSMSYVVMMLFSGFLVSLDSIGAWLRWLKYFSVVKYGLESLYITEFKDQEFCAFNTTCSYGNQFLENAGIDYKEDWDYWKNIMANFLFAILALVVTYINLRFAKKHR